MLPYQAMQLTWSLTCLIPIGLFGALYFFMRRLGQVLPLPIGITIILFYTLVIGFLFFTVGFPMLADLNQRLIYQRIQSDLDTQCGAGAVDVGAGQLNTSGVNEWRLDSQVMCELIPMNAQWTCTCPTLK